MWLLIHTQISVKFSQQPPDDKIPRVVILVTIAPWQTTWSTDGVHARILRFTRMNGGEIVTADCGGACGWCYSGRNGNIYVNVNQDRGTQVH